MKWSSIWLIPFRLGRTYTFIVGEGAAGQALLERAT